MKIVGSAPTETGAHAIAKLLSAKDLLIISNSPSLQAKRSNPTG
jgi:hypothetical protein